MRALELRAVDAWNRARLAWLRARRTRITFSEETIRRRGSSADRGFLVGRW